MRLALVAALVVASSCGPATPTTVTMGGKPTATSRSTDINVAEYTFSLDAKNAGEAGSFRVQVDASGLPDLMTGQTPQDSVTMGPYQIAADASLHVSEKYSGPAYGQTPSLDHFVFTVESSRSSGGAAFVQTDSACVGQRCN